MKIVRPLNIPPEARRVFRARVDALWVGQTLKRAELVVDELAILSQRRGKVVLDRPTTATNGLRETTVDVIEREFRDTRDDAILFMHERLMRRIDASYSHEDVRSGRVSEAAVVLSGLV